MSFRPAGFGTVTPRIFVEDVDGCVSFLRSVSGLSDVRPTPFPAFLYVYVDRRAMVADPQGNVFQIAHHLTS